MNKIKMNKTKMRHMTFDRNHLNSVGFVRPCVADSRHARIPHDFLKTIGSVEALVVYTLLRDVPPTHRWNGKCVKGRLIEYGLSLSMQRVEKAMALLNRQGWIRYVDLKAPNGRKAGAITEVQYEQLPAERRKKNRVIEWQHSGSFRMLEHDRTEVDPADYAPKGYIKKSSAGQADVVAEKQAQQPQPLIPGVRLPEERLPGDEYKGLLIEESLTLSGEREKAIPLGEELGPDGPEVECDEVPGGDAMPHDTENCAAANVISKPAEASSRINWDEVHAMAKAARLNPESRMTYEQHLDTAVFPHLIEPPNDEEHWTKTKLSEWCQSSEKAGFMLSLALEDSWTPDLARRFVKAPARWSVAGCKSILRSGSGVGFVPVTLGDLIPSNQQRKSGEDAQLPPWEKLIQRANSWEATERKLIYNACKKYGNAGKSDDELIKEAEKITRYATGDTYAFFPEKITDEEDRDLFYKLLSRHQNESECEVSRPGFDHADLAARMNRHVASDRVAFIVARFQQFQFIADKIWGIDWQVVAERHAAVAEELNWRADFYRLDSRVEPDNSWFDRLIQATENGIPIPVTNGFAPAVVIGSPPTVTNGFASEVIHGLPPTPVANGFPPSVTHGVAPAFTNGPPPSVVNGPPPTFTNGPPPSVVNGPPPTFTNGPPPSVVNGPPPTFTNGPPPAFVNGPPPTIVNGLPS